MIVKIVYTVFQILSIYLVLIGTWRLASATKKRPSGSDLQTYQESEETYNPLKDLVSIIDVVFWIFETVKTFRAPGYFADAVIFHKQFQWGLFWLMSGILIQFVLSALL